MNKFVLIYNYFIEDYYSASHVIPFKTNHTVDEIKRIISDFIEELRIKKSEYDTLYKLWSKEDARIREDGGYWDLEKEYKILQKKYNIASNGPKAQRDYNIIAELSSQMQAIYEKRQSLHNPADPPESPNNKLFISDTFSIQINIRSYEENTFEILTLDEWFERESTLNNCPISVK